MNVPKRFSLFYTVLILAILIFHLWSLMRYPIPFVDEAWHAARAWSFIQQGKPFSSLDSGVFDRFPGHATYFPWLPVVLQSIAMWFFYQPELLAVRLVSLFFGLVLLIATYYIGECFGGKKVGLISALILAISHQFVYSSHLARYDIIVSAFGFSALSLYLRQKPEKKFWPSFLAGLLAVLAVEIHAYGIIYTPVILLLFLIEMKSAVLRNKGLWGFIVGAIIAGLFYIERHILYFPDTYWEITNIAFSPTHIPPLLTFDLRVILLGLLDTKYVWFSLLGLLPIGIIAIGYEVALVIKKHRSSEMLLIILVLLLFFFYGLLIRTKLNYYAILIMPILVILIGRFLAKTWRNWQGSFLDYINRTSWGIVLTLSIYIIIVILTHPNAYKSFQLDKERISQSITNEDSLMGSQIYWFGFYDNLYYSWETIIYYQRLKPGSTFSDAMYEFQPDIFIVDEHLSTFMVDGTNPQHQPSNHTLYYQSLHLSAQDVQQFMHEQGKLMDTFTSQNYGKIEIYRIYWEKTQD
jgi:4-amino-4-deoxy-L-arabinose transferase-like glycosyltransferase